MVSTPHFTPTLAVWNSLLPTGYHNPSSGKFKNQGGQAILWSASEDDIGYAYSQVFNFANAVKESTGKNMGYSLRCLKDSN